MNNPRQFWKNIKEVIPKSKSKITSSAPFIKDYSVSDNDESQQKRKANIFCTFFSSVANNLKRKTIKLCNFTWRKLKSNLIRTTSKFKFRLVNKFWVKNQLRLLKRSKATGPDNLPPEMLKDCSNELSGPLCYLINFSISVTIPNEWKLAKVILIFKYEDSTDPNNYRPISILPILSKILEWVVHSQLLDHFEKSNLLTNCQYGYRKNRSNDLASTLLLDDIRKSAQQTHQLLYLIENESSADVHLSTLFQRWQNNVETTSIELRWFNVYEPMLFQLWNLVEIESWADVCLSTLFQSWQNNVETTLKELRQFSVDDPMLFQRWYLVENKSWIKVYSSVLIQRGENSIETTLSIAALICTDVH